MARFAAIITALFICSTAQANVESRLPFGTVFKGREQFDRLVAATLPRIRDFRGTSPRSFDGRGNYSIGIADQTVFPEIELDKIKRQQGMDITIVTSAPTDQEAMELLKLMGMPFAETKSEPKPESK